ncbi:unnamed protein product [Polarella glacialis]|uniref:Uncharacterized protein n=1 Tax=Polarella glacialis TaxID=89957 RepID=A0A813IVU2_POLGL|nr:unnamed protein product [Polarella glacialis]CAE8663138.1 unnamed protein product [Polarella glacialis]
MSLLGTKSWYGTGDSVIPFTGWKIFPHVVAPEAEEGTDLEDLVEKLGGAGVVILGVHKGGGMIFNKDGLLEPARQMIQEYRWDWQSSSVKQALLIGPPRCTGLICPLYAAMRRDAANSEDDDFKDAYAYALTQEEEAEEEQLIGQFDVHNQWLNFETRAEVEDLKRQGNEAFKAKQADLANLHYEKARVMLRSAARRWEELEKDLVERLDALAAPKPVAGSQLPSEKRQTVAENAALGTKEDYQVSNMLVPLLLNICASYLVAHEQDLARRKEQPAEESASSSSSQGNVDGDTTMLVEVRNNLVAAFRAVNEALLLSGGRSAKAWYRRGCVFEQMRDPRNALQDLQEALLRAPGDKAITKKRDEIQEAANKVAENMYYARHKELDAQEKRLQLETRRALFLQAETHRPDSYVDEQSQFAIAQPLARLIEGTLEEPGCLDYNMRHWVVLHKTYCYQLLFLFLLLLLWWSPPPPSSSSFSIRVVVDTCCR